MKIYIFKIYYKLNKLFFKEFTTIMEYNPELIINIDELNPPKD